MTNALGAGATTVSSLTTSGVLLLPEDAAVLTHSAASGTSLAISSTNGYVSIARDVESVRITDATWSRARAVARDAEDRA